jgi:3-isopropylmalate/(R)-2-methylmalate dehydratase small subunit
MEKFTRLTSKVVVIPVDNIDTDQIIPARFLKAIDKTGMGDNLFADWRYYADGTPKVDFILNRPEVKGRQILMAGDNFGCGSSREHAPWALTGFGFRAVISTSFADIFSNNALKNGLLPVVIDGITHRALSAWLAEVPAAELTIDLDSQILVLPDGRKFSFPIDPFARSCLLNGVDELGYILSFNEAITAYEKRNNIIIGK